MMRVSEARSGAEAAGGGEDGARAARDLAAALMFREILKPLAEALGPIGDAALGPVADALALRRDP